ncbi:MAG: sortase [candidate division WWE3 bacterium]|nr:sortase [candidate division WWE3 bacterium]
MNHQKFWRQFLGNLLIISSLLILVLAWGPIIKSELNYQLNKLTGHKFCLPSDKTCLTGQSDTLGQKPSPFSALIGRLIVSTPTIIQPINREFAIVIEKINVNAPIISNVSVTDPAAYNKALRDGVAQAINTAVPSDPRGNVYLFAHSSLDFWQLGQYATVFNLVRKLEQGDTIHVFYHGFDYTYSVINKEIVAGFNTYPLDRRTIEPILTIQTCDPPGTTLNRLVVTAKLTMVK